MPDRILLRGLRVFARHGVYPEEKAAGQTFVIDVAIGIDLTAAATGDRLEDTLDYGALVTGIHNLVAGEEWNLIERVAQRVAELVLEDLRVSEVEVTVHKPQAPLAVPVDDVAVIRHLRR